MHCWRFCCWTAPIRRTCKKAKRSRFAWSAAWEVCALTKRLHHLRGFTTSRATQPGGAVLRVAILDVLPRLPFPRSLQVVVEALQDPALAVRSQAQASLARLGTVELLGRWVRSRRCVRFGGQAGDCVGAGTDCRSAGGRTAAASVSAIRRSAAARGPSGLVSLRDASLRPLYERALLSVSADRAQDLNILISELFPSGL